MVKDALSPRLLGKVNFAEIRSTGCSSTASSYSSCIYVEEENFQLKKANPFLGLLARKLESLDNAILKRDKASFLQISLISFRASSYNVINISPDTSNAMLERGFNDCF